MLTHLSINNFAIVDQLCVDFQRGMTVVSGETGAGKSIMIDALQLALGKRGDSSVVRQGEKKADIIADFDISAIPQAQAWLDAQELSQDGECILRRVLSADGRSKAFINGRSCPLNSLRELGSYLVAIHGQHEHQNLLQREHHRSLLDNFAKHNALAAKTANHYQLMTAQRKQLERLLNNSAEQQEKVQLLSYQVEELQQLSVSEGEVEQLELELKTLSQAEEILHSGHSLLAMLDAGDQNHCSSLLHQSIQLQQQLPQCERVETAGELLNSALIQLEEASAEISHYLDHVELNPARLQEVEQRLSAIYDLARKHRIDAEQLFTLEPILSAQLAQISCSDEQIEHLQGALHSARETYLNSARKLSAQRTKAAKKLSAHIDKHLHMLGMPNAHFSIQLSEFTEQQYSAHGLEDIEFLIATNSGHSAKALAKIASGGELSRISLAIQVATAQSNTTSTLMFDEVDVGIGGGIAEVVGKLLRQLGERSQVMCITHQPQVASQGHQHLFVSKKSSKHTTSTAIIEMTQEQRVNEVARMLGGIDITPRTLDHAREMLGPSQ